MCFLRGVSVGPCEPASPIQDDIRHENNHLNLCIGSRFYEGQLKGELQWLIDYAANLLIG